MNIKLITQNILRFLLLILIQVLILNHVYLGGFINPFLYVLFVMMLPTRMEKIPVIVIAFLSGLIVDLFSNMLGFHAMACTLVAFCKVTFANKILTKNDPTEIDIPTIHSVGFQSWAYYTLLLTLIYNLAYFLIEIFSFRDILTILISSVSSTLVTWILMLIYHLIFLRKKSVQRGGGE